MAKKIDVEKLRKWVEEHKRLARNWMKGEMKEFKEYLEANWLHSASQYASELSFDCGYLSALGSLEDVLEEVEE